MALIWPVSGLDGQEGGLGQGLLVERGDELLLGRVPALDPDLDDVPGLEQAVQSCLVPRPALDVVVGQRAEIALDPDLGLGLGHAQDDGLDRCRPGSSRGVVQDLSQ